MRHPDVVFSADTTPAIRYVRAMRGPGVDTLITDLESVGISLWEEDGKLRFRAPKGVMTPERLASLRDNKAAVLDHLRGVATEATVIAAPEARFEPFPLTDVQAAYLLGRREVFAYGGVACHGYGELAFDTLDPARLEWAFQGLIRRHEMLRAVVHPDGSQRVLADVPAYRVLVDDLTGAPAAEVDRALAATRAAMDHKVYEPGTWPLFELRLTRTDERTLLHLSVDFLIADFVSIQVMLDELHRLYTGGEDALPELELTFRDYLRAERRLRASSRARRDRDYWWERVDSLPPAPELPMRVGGPATSGPARFRRHALRLEPDEWDALRRRAGAHNITPSVAVLAAYTETIAAWSRQSAFTLNLTLLNRLPLHPQVGQLIGDFTAVNLLAVDRTAGAGFADRARALQARLWQDLDHRLCSRRGGAARAGPPPWRRPRR